jgi:hypothetical protein
VTGTLPAIFRYVLVSSRCGMETTMGKGLILWLLGVPGILIVLLLLFRVI